MPLEAVDEGCGVQISPRQVFLQEQPSGPLTRARRGDAPMSRYSPFAIRSDSTLRQSGLAVRPPVARPRLSGFDAAKSFGGFADRSC